MRKFTLLTSVLLTAPFAVGNVSAQCVATQDCASLGYTETSCENGGIKCPFGNAWACKSENNSQGNGTTACTYGAIYFSDGSCAADLISGKKPIGVVVSSSTEGTWIMALPSREPMRTSWSTENVDVPNIKNYLYTKIDSHYYDDEKVIYDMKSCENTDAMIVQGFGKYPAAQYARGYAPVDAPETKGKWCLPSGRIINDLDNNITLIDEAFKKSSVGLEDTIYSGFWSASEYSRDRAWMWSINVNTKEIHTEMYDKSNAFTVLPVMKIQ